MSIYLLFILLTSNAVTLRRDLSILFNRIVIKGLGISFNQSKILINTLDFITLRRHFSIQFKKIGLKVPHISLILGLNILFVKSSDKGIALYSELFHISFFTQSFHIFIFLIGGIILNLTAFYPRKVYVKEHSSLFNILLNRVRLTIIQITDIICIFYDLFLYLSKTYVYLKYIYLSIFYSVMHANTWDIYIMFGLVHISILILFYINYIDKNFKEKYNLLYYFLNIICIFTIVSVLVFFFINALIFTRNKILDYILKTGPSGCFGQGGSGKGAGPSNPTGGGGGGPSNPKGGGGGPSNVGETFGPSTSSSKPGQKRKRSNGASEASSSNPGRRESPEAGLSNPSPIGRGRRETAPSPANRRRTSPSPPPFPSEIAAMYGFPSGSGYASAPSDVVTASGLVWGKGYATDHDRNRDIQLTEMCQFRRNQRIFLEETGYAGDLRKAVEKMQRNQPSALTTEERQMWDVFSHPGGLHVNTYPWTYYTFLPPINNLLRAQQWALHRMYMYSRIIEDRTKDSRSPSPCPRSPDSSDEQ